MYIYEITHRCPSQVRLSGQPGAVRGVEPEVWGGGHLARILLLLTIILSAIQHLCICDIIYLYCQPARLPPSNVGVYLGLHLLPLHNQTTLLKLYLNGQSLRWF